MAEASINLKLSPREFDLLRSALKEQVQNLHTQVSDKTLGADVRSERRQREAEVRLIIEKLK